MTRRRLRDWLTALALAGALAAAVMWLPGERADGRARVIDGDSLRIGEREIRLFGIDAPESRQTCTRPDGSRWRCGRAAAALLEELTAAGMVACRGREEDRYGRLVATCTAGDVDLGAELVRRGYALAYRQHSSRYVDEESEAKAAGRGVWSGRIEAPWRWRERHRSRRAPGGSAISTSRHRPRPNRAAAG